MRRHLLVLIQLLGLISLAGCASQGGITTHEKPWSLNQLGLPHSLEVSDSDTNRPKPKPQAWWQAYGDDQLNELMAQALRNNPSLAVARARIHQAEGAAAVQGAALVPEVTATGQVGRARWTEDQFFPPPFGGSRTWNNAVSLHLSYDFDLWGQNKASQQAAIDQVHARRAETQAAELLLAMSLVQDYVHYAQLLALHDQTADLARINRHVLKIERIRLQHGLSNAKRVLASVQALARTEQQLDGLNGQIALTREQIAILTGQGASLPKPLRKPGLRLNADWAEPKQVPADLIGQRPDVRARRWVVESAAEQIHVARAAFYPNINLAAYIGGLAASANFGQFLKPSAAHSGITPAFTLPIFEGGRLRGNLRERTSQYDEAVANYNKTLLTALAQTAQAITQVHTLKAQQQTLSTETAAAQANAALARQHYAAGLSNRLPVLAAEANLIELRRQAIDIDAGALGHLTTLYAALGGTVLPDTLPQTRKPQ